MRQAGFFVGGVGRGLKGRATGAALTLLLASVATHSAAGTIGLESGDTCVVISSSASADQASLCTKTDPDTGLFEYRLGESIRLGGDDGFEITSLFFSGNADPSISYSVSVVDFGTPSVFGFAFFTPIVADNYTHATASFDAQLLGAGESDVELDPVAPATLIQVGKAGSPPVTNLGVDVGSACSGLGLVDCPAESAEAFFAATAYSGLSVELAFGLSGDGDSASITGGVELDKQTPAVPEPGTLLLLGTGLVGLLARRRRT